MNYKTINYTLTVAISKEEALEIIMLLTEDYPVLFKASNIRINQNNNPTYSDIVILDLAFTNGLYEELMNFENDLVNNNLLPNQWKITKEVK